MTQFKRVIAGLDFSSLDSVMLKYLGTLHESFPIETLYALHILPSFSAPRIPEGDFVSRFIQDQPLDEVLTDKLKKEITAIFGENPPFLVRPEVIEGKPSENIIHRAEVKKADLLVLGRKTISEGSGIVAKRVARQATCPVLFVTENAKAPQKIIVPIDYSEFAARALLTALDRQILFPETEIHALHIVEFPPNDYYMLPYKEAGFRKILEDSAKEAYEKFISDYHIPKEKIKAVYRENISQNPAKHIVEYAKEINTDLILTGARGHSVFRNMLFGSVTEALIEHNHEFPLLIVR